MRVVKRVNARSSYHREKYFFFYFFNVFIFGRAGMVLPWGLSSSCKRGYSLVAAHGLFFAVASLIAKHGL